MSFGSTSSQQLGPLLMRSWEHFSSRLAPHFPTMGLQGRTRCIVGAGGRELGQVSATLEISSHSWHQLAPPVPHPDGLLSLLWGGEGGGRGVEGACQGQTWYKLTHRAPMPWHDLATRGHASSERQEWCSAAALFWRPAPASLMERQWWGPAVPEGQRQFLWRTLLFPPESWGCHVKRWAL